MLHELRLAIRPAVSLLLLLTLVTGIGYPLLMTGVAQLVFPGQANGSLIRQDGRVIGSSLIGQSFTSPGYFHGRPSAAGDGYDAASSAASNLAPGSADLAARIAEARASEGLTSMAPPADLVTTSASGLDPHVSPEAAFVQAPRIAAARGVAQAEVEALIRAAIEEPLLGFLGERRVNALALNRQLDRIAAAPPT
ncbi:potassium-transporting ATPase subunit KdpC [Croceibacterium ferulae]|uniref:potassium-transporting ATPase subunit KdpC n=1 Tax=Croceibacterium ferulae TaxID=1854641 RepID=UPI000EB2D557|nr:potassium-transporting ATPase subunit KdpC [Croceibacterium ferulae]